MKIILIKLRKEFNKKTILCRKRSIMETHETYLQYGEKIIIEPGDIIYKQNHTPEEKPVYFIIAGLVKLEFNSKNGTVFPHYLQPDNVFGIIEPLTNTNRLTNAYAMEKTMLYRWTIEDFYTASSISWELTYIAITGLTRLLRILNAEFGEKLGLLKGKAYE